MVAYTVGEVGFKTESLYMIIESIEGALNTEYFT